jgi:hypothetical protein
MSHRIDYRLALGLTFSLAVADVIRPLPLQGTTALPSLRKGYALLAVCGK